MNRMGLCAFCFGLLMASTLGQPLNEPEWEVDRLTNDRIDSPDILYWPERSMGVRRRRSMPLFVPRVWRSPDEYEGL